MRFHILGICGTFMSGIALLAKQAGHEVSGSDTNVYPPMSTQLSAQGIPILEGYRAEDIPHNVDQVIVGNVIKRGNPAMEHILSKKIPFTSGPQWLSENILKDRWVLAVAGTHGKTTTTSLLAWILEKLNCTPGFLIGGIPENFGISARLGSKPYFVIEADEYDSAFFDKRSKFIHYNPKTLVLNNLEFDHADIFTDLEAIKLQFHHLLRTVPANGLILQQSDDQHLFEVIKMGCWTPVQTFGDSGLWHAELIKSDGSQFKAFHAEKLIGEISWELLGKHNVMNALAALAAASHIGLPDEKAIEAIASFKNVKRRLEIKGKPKNIWVYDDFAHHPTAIATTLQGLRAKIGNQARMIAVLEFGSYTMRTGVHKNRLSQALETADMIICKSTETDWGLQALLKEFNEEFNKPAVLYDDVDTLVKQLAPQLQTGDHVVIMSNSGFGGIHHKLINAIEKEV